MNCKKTAIRFSFLSLCVLSCFSSCATTVKRAPFVYLTNNSKYFLLPSDCIEKPIDMAQFMSVSFQNQNYSFNTWVQADANGMEITLINELGASIAEISFKNRLAAISSQAFPNSLKPEYIIADFQLCFYNAAHLALALEACGLSLENTETKRRIFQGKTVIIEIDKNPTAVRLVNHLRGYEYSLEGDFK